MNQNQPTSKGQVWILIHIPLLRILMQLPGTPQVEAQSEWELHLEVNLQDSGERFSHEETKRQKIEKKLRKVTQTMLHILLVSVIMLETVRALICLVNTARAQFAHIVAEYGLSAHLEESMLLELLLY